MASVRCSPSDNSECKCLTVLITMYSEPQGDSIYIDQNTRIRVLENISQLPSTEKDQCGVFMVRISSLLTVNRHHFKFHSYSVTRAPCCHGATPSNQSCHYHDATTWTTNSSSTSDEPAKLPDAQRPSTANYTATPSMIGSQFELNPTPNDSGDLDEKTNPESDPAARAAEEKQTPQKRSWWSWRLQPVTNRHSCSC